MARNRKPIAEQTMTAAPTGGALAEFARVAEAVAATTKKLEKAALLGAYFHTLDDADLVRAARYFAGQQFAQNDARTTNVGTNLLRDVISDVTGFEAENLRPRYVRLGDSGEVAHEAFREAGRDEVNQPVFTLAAVESLVATLSDTPGTKNKRALLAGAFARATALEAKYLVKLLVGDLRIGLKEGLVEDALARAFERPLADVARANMLTGDIGETAVRARRDEFAGVSMRLFHPIKFMLATAGEDLTDIARTMPAEFYVEDKFDGIRAQAHVEGGRVALYTRTLDEVTHRFPELVAPLAALSTDAIMDGEIVPARGNEGLMIKDPRSSYKPGKRGREWLKLKRALATLDVVVTAVEVGHGKRRNLLSDYTFAVRRAGDDPELLNVGKAYSGLTDVELAELTEWFRAHTLQEFAHGRVRTVEPRIILEVTFDRVQASKRHKSGYALRFPRILRLRDDKSVDEIDTLETVSKLADAGGGDDAVLT
jgi:ATP-dependent DNA ligase